MNRKRIIFFVLGIILLMNSCNILSLVEPTPTAMPTSTVTPVLSPTSTFTPTPIPPPMLSVSTEVPCRAGPGDLYDLIVNLQAGEMVEIVGKAEMFWIVKSTVGAECWVSYEQVNIEGEVAALPVVVPPPTPIPTLPAPPAHVKLIKQTCSVDYSSRPAMYVNEFHLTWKDMSNNEDGFRVYRDGDLVAEISANKTDVIDVVIRRNKRVYMYYVNAYNEVGESKSEVVTFSCGK
jgi:uncharacterized protein YraI